MKTAIIDQPTLPPFDETSSVPAAGGPLMFERLAADPNVPVEKLERLIAMQERIYAHNAKAEFDAAFSEMQGEIPVITERGEILVNGQLRSKYARFEDILEVVRPILQRHGFAIRHRNTFSDGKIKIVGILSHRSGHSEEDEFEAKADTSGSKNDIQALGSTRSYGQRYTTNALLGIATRGSDDDGAGASKAGKPDVQAPVGFEDWWFKLMAVANEGFPRLSAEWECAKPEYRAHVLATNKDGMNALKAKSRTVKVSS